jgi:exodeoxyribonuclease V gamma subunit
MVRLVYSNRTEELLSELGARVRGQQTTHGPLVPVRIVVPSRSLETHVRLGIARDQGIAANLDVELLTRFAAVVAAPAGARVADAIAIEAMALQLLLDDAALGHPDLAAVVGYLRAAGDSADAMDLRRVQLAARVGRLFEEYTYSRGELLVEWERGAGPTGARGEVEVWQRRLWLAMFGPEGLGRGATPRKVPLHEAVAALAPGAATWPAAVHVFGFAHVARTFHQLLARIGQVTEVVVYTLSPCEGFWEDIDPRDPQLLSLWSRPGREHVRALNALAAFDHDDRFVEGTTPPATLLHELQSDLLHRRGTPARSVRASPSEPSFVVLEHASIRRECEAVASAIWEAVREDPTLPFDAIAVLVPQSEAASYAAHLGAAFHEAHSIPHQSLGLPDPTPSRVVEAIELLLSLPLGQFTRPELLKLLVHPSVVASVEDADPEASPVQWLNWCEELGIVHGADHADHEATYIARDILNWDQGLRRLALGAFMTGEASGEPSSFLAGDHAYLPHELAGTDLHDAATFGLLVRSLVADARFARSAVLSPRKWADFLSTLVETYVAPTNDAEADELSRRLRQLGSIGDVDLGGREVGFRIASELARARLAAGGAARGGEGVVVSTIGAARGIPARVLFACGLGEGRFPSADAEDPLDLRWSARREGDVTARERDKYAFLEVLLGVRDRLVLSYVSRDPLTGDALSASSVVQELLHTLASAYGREPGTLCRRHPLRRWDPAYFPQLFGAQPALDEGRADLGTMDLPEARAEAATLAVRRSAERHGTRLALHDVVAGAEQGDPAWVRLAEHLRVAPLPKMAPVTDVRIAVPMHALVKFLELPLQGWAKQRLGLDETDDEDLASRETEPFETAPRDETLLLREVLLDAAARGQSIEDAYDTVARKRELRGTGPSGVFAQGERGDHLRTLGEWRETLEQHGVSVDSLAIHRFGRGGEHTRAHHVHEGLVLDVGVEDASNLLRMVRVEIAGRTLPVGGPTPTSVVLAKRANEPPREEWAVAGRRRSFLRALVDYAVLAASGAVNGEGHSALLVVSTRDQPAIEPVAFGPLPQDAAKQWLRGLLSELLGAPHAYFFPCEAVFVHHARGEREPLVEVLEEARDKLGSGDGPPALRSAYGPVPRPQTYPMPDEAAARAMAARRLLPLLSVLPRSR